MSLEASTELHTKQVFDLDEHGCGCPWDNFLIAVGTYCYLNVAGSRWPTVREIALAFRVTDDVVRAAANDDYWASLVGPDDDATKQHVELDGD